MDEFVERFKREVDNRSRRTLSHVLTEKQSIPYNHDSFVEQAHLFSESLSTYVKLMNQEIYVINAFNKTALNIDKLCAPVSRISAMGVFAQWTFSSSVAHALLPLTTKPFCSNDFDCPSQEYQSLITPFPHEEVKYGYVAGTGEIKPLGMINPKVSEYTYRYVPNVNIQTVLKSDRKLTDAEKERPIYPSWKILCNLVRTQSNQTRSQRMSKAWMCQALYSLVRIFGVHPDRSFPHWCSNCPDPFPSLFIKLWKDEVVPRFDDGGDTMRFADFPDTLFAHTKLHYSTLNGLDQYGFGNISSGVLHARMLIHDKWSLTSFDDNHLKAKGKMNNSRKLLHELLTKVLAYKYSTSDCIGVQEISIIPEVWMDNEKEQLIKEFENLDLLYQQLFTYTQSIITQAPSLKQRNFLISGYIQLSIITNPSDYKFTAVPLEYDRSAKPVNNTPNALSLTLETLYDFKTKVRFFGILDDMTRLLKEYYPLIIDKFQATDFMQKFWDFLTNNSAGIPSDAKALGKEKLRSNLVDNDIAKAFGKRYVTGLVEKPDMYDPLKRLVDQRRETLAGHRKQIDRRVRFISQVGNVYQAVSNVSNIQVKLLAQHCNTLVVGEQTGKITDLIEGLYGSSEEETVLMDNDIKGMDTATQEITSWWPLWVAFHMSSGTQQTLFDQPSSTLPVIEWNELGATSSKSENVIYKEFNGLQQVIAQVGSTAKSNRYVYVDGVACDKFYISGTAFPTGAANTSANHNLTLGMASEAIARKYQRDARSCKPIINMKVMGDDFEGIVKFTEGSQSDKDDAARFLMEKFIEHYAELGYIAEPEMSRYKGVFLQQTAILGAFMPLPARLSMQCAERGDSRNVDQISQLVELQDLVDEMTGRSHYPNYEIPYLRIWWTVNRSTPIGFNLKELDPFLSIDLAFKIPKVYVKTNETKQMYHFLLPMMLVQFPENCGLTPYPIITKDNESIIPSYLTPRGTISYKVVYMGLETESEPTANIKRHWESFKQSVIHKKFPYLDDVKSVPIRYRLDQHLARELNLHIVRRIIKDNPFRKDPDMIKVTESVEKSTVLISANDTLDQKRADKSRFAAINLGQKGIRYSNSVAYYNSGKERLIQTLKAVEGERLQWDEVNLRIIKWAKNLTRTKSRNFVKLGNFYHDNDYLHDYNIYATKTSPSPNNYEFLSKSDFGPTCATGSEIWEKVIQLRPPFGDASQWQTIESIKDVIPAGGNAETILREATNCYSISHASLTDYLNLIGVSDQNLSSVRAKVISYIKARPPKYQSIAHTRKFFYCSTSPEATERLLEKSGWNNTRSARTLSQAIILDHLLMGRLDATSTYVVDYTKSGIAGLLANGVRLG